MRYVETLPAWMARQRNRRLIRHSDEKVVRWIGHNHVAKDGEDGASQARDSSINDNVVAFGSGRSIHAS